MDSFSSLPSSGSSSPFLGGDEKSSVNKAASVDGDSRSVSPPPEDTEPNGNLGGTSVTEVRLTATSARPEAKITFDIRAHSAEQKSSHQQLSKFQNTMSSQLEAAGKAWKAEPRYNFTQRATLYKAYIQAQAKFNTLNAFIHLEQAHVNYLDALGRSSLSPDKQHAMYSTFQEAMKKAGADRCFLNTFDVNYSGKSTTLVEAATRNATQSQQLVQKLLKDIQKPHTELRNDLKGPPELRKDLVATLRHKEALRAPATGDEAAKLNDEIATLKVFLNSRQLASLDEKTASPLTTLVRAADQKYGNWQRLETAAKTLETAAAKAVEEAAKETSATTTEEELAQAKAKQEKMEALNVLVANANQARQAADAARTASEEADIEVMHAVRELGPPVTFYATQDGRAVSSTLPPIPLTTSSSSTAAAAISLPENELPLAEDESIEERAVSALSTSSTTSTTSTSASSADLKSLWKFTEKLQNSRFPNEALPSESSKKQLASLQKFLALDESAVAALPPDKLKNLVDRMKEIEEKNKQRITPQEQLSSIQTETTDSETQFISALET